MTTIETRFTRVESIHEQTMQQMFTLFAHYYDHTSFDQFHKDICEKDLVLLFIESQTGHVVGFSTILKRVLTYRPGKKATFIFSGDTIMRRDYWGSRILQTAFFKVIYGAKVKAPFRPVYWMLMSKGYKTYLLMRRNFGDSYPAYNKPFDPELKRAMDWFYREKYGSSYDAEKGLIRFAKVSSALKPDVAPPRETGHLDPEIEFFLEKNPNYLAGHELACITRIRLAEFPLLLAKYFLRPILRKLRAPSVSESKRRVGVVR